MMNKLFLYLFFLVFPFNLAGQIHPLSNHFHFNSLTINPAFAGSNNAISASINYRNQWAGFKDAPKSGIIAVHSPVRSGRIGIGFQVENRSTGIYKTTNIVGNYAYRTEIKKGTLAMGLGFGAAVYSINWKNLQAIDLNDHELQYNSSSAVMPVFSVGMYYYTKKYYFGFSLPSFISHNVGQNSGDYKAKNDMSNYNYLVTTGYDIDLNSDLILSPSLLLKYNSKDAIQIDLNSWLGYKEKVWIGLGYRNNNTFTGMLQCQLNFQLKMAYAYDFETGEIGKYINGSHEIGLNYIFRYSRKVIGPRHF
jgi:type IX secretion system PorP/SprF family membrane protein